MLRSSEKQNSSNRKSNTKLMENRSLSGVWKRSTNPGMYLVESRNEEDILEAD